MGSGRSKRRNKGSGRRKNPASDAGIRPQEIRHPHRLKVVVIDDDPVARESMARGFDEAGHEVYQHIAGATALPRIVRKRPDVVVVDLVMSEMNGLELCREIRRHPELAETIVVIVSGVEDAYWAFRAVEDGAAALTLKPMDRAGVAGIEGIVRAEKTSMARPDAA